MPPLVSIIIPCYKAERWLAGTLESALAQAWTATEIIVINDGSPDGSLAVAQKFTDRRVRVVDQPNRGASAARNHGLRLARGEFIQFLDADDLISPDKIAAQMELLRARPAGTVATCAWGRFQTDPATAQFSDTEVFRDFVPMDFLVLAGNTGAMMHPSCWLLPRAVAERAGPWDESLSLNDDGEYFCRALLASAGMTYCPAGRSYYRSGLTGSLSQQRTDRARRSQFHSLELIISHLRATEDSPRTRQAAANYYQRFVYDFFPAPADLMQQATERVTLLGGSTLTAPPMGGRTRWLASLLGWKNAWRLKHLLRH
jgi:glycosyltransferase involved in cell wall biosynthesis